MKRQHSRTCCTSKALISKMKKRRLRDVQNCVQVTQLVQLVSNRTKFAQSQSLSTPTLDNWLYIAKPLQWSPDKLYTDQTAVHCTSTDQKMYKTRLEHMHANGIEFLNFWDRSPENHISIVSVPPLRLEPAGKERGGGACWTRQALGPT